MAPRDAQASGSATEVKQRDGGVDHLILLLPRTRRTTAFIAAAGALLLPNFPIEGRRALALLTQGLDPAGTRSSCSEPSAWDARTAQVGAGPGLIRQPGAPGAPSDAGGRRRPHLRRVWAERGEKTARCVGLRAIRALDAQTPRRRCTGRTKASDTPAAARNRRREPPRRRPATERRRRTSAGSGGAASSAAPTPADVDRRKRGTTWAASAGGHPASNPRRRETTQRRPRRETCPAPSAGSDSAPTPVLARTRGRYPLTAPPVIPRTK